MGDMLKNGHILGSIPTLSDIKIENKILKRALSAPLRIVAQNRSISSKQALELDVLYAPFPVGRLCEIIEKAISVATTLGSVGHIVWSKK